MLGFDPRARNAIELLFKNRLNGRFVLVEAEQASLCMIDLDRHGGRDLWARHSEANPDRPMILLSMNEVDTQGTTRFVRKPMRPEELVSALTVLADHIQGDAGTPGNGQRRPLGGALIPPRVGGDTKSGSEPSSPKGEIPSPRPVREEGVAASALLGNVGQRLAERDTKTFIGSAPDIDPSDREQVAKAQFDPDAYLIGRLSHAVKLARSANRPARLELKHGAITILPHLGQAVIELQQCQLRSLAGIPLAEEQGKVRFVEDVDLVGLPPERLWPLDALLWTSALLASRGRVPVGTDLGAEIRLKRWPNLTRLAVCPNAVRITALLSREPISLITAARTLKIPQRFVFAFFSAAEALDLVERSAVKRKKTTESDVAVPAMSRVLAKRGLFQRILSHLHK
ncbi:hypothetical protein [Thiocystis violacea]|uniref:hypothetical protein n=1 Tax=Thiocystis violacea TaxID=13725 RepID=UPI001908533C|nr:hypothetical protein [Thiocystis violacea]MBK1718194.1 hypothetical protein [Thiocystis violacea]